MAGHEQLAIAWFVFFSLAAGLVGATKFAYAGWGLQIPEVGFTVISGHTMLSGAVYPLAFFLSLSRSGSRASMWAALGGFLFAALIGLSRVPTGAHTPSEVIAGWMLGSAVSAVLLILLERREPRQTSVRFAAAAVAIVCVCYGHLAPIQDWIASAAPELARAIGSARSWR
ncbi:phosphatase PAP2 family protein [Cupriavidus sp. TMH.W2]|uniref:phosphatase PAP2 family protein n=1 Tax=Cupriavidus sp. TMH.W2 TaxID=3434465 RepID=UPI003D76D1FE